MLKRIKQFALSNQTIGQTVAKNFIWLGVGQIGSRVIKALIIIYVARVLGAGEFGVISYILGLTGFFAILADIGIGPMLNRVVAQRMDNEKNYVATILIIKLVLLVVTTALILTIVPFLTKIEAAQPLIPFVTLMIIFDNLRDFASYFFRGKEKMELEALVVGVVNISIALFSLLALKFLPNATGISIAYALSSFTSFLVGAYFLREYWSVASIKLFRPELVKEIFRSAWPIAVGGLAGSFMFNVDTIMLSWWRTAEEIGRYSASQKVVGLVYVVSGLVTISTFSPVARLVKEGQTEKLRLILRKIFLLLSSLSFPIVFGSWALGNQIIPFIFGQSYAPASAYFYVLISLVLLMYPLNICNNLIFSYDRQVRILPYIVISSIVNVLGNLILIPPYGALGAAWATLLASAVNFYLIFRFSKKLVQFEIIRPATKIILVSLLMGGVAYIFKTAGINLILNITLSALVYIGTLFLLKDEIIKEFKQIIFNHFLSKTN